jgi:hypothetical protein
MSGGRKVGNADGSNIPSKGLRYEFNELICDACPERNCGTIATVTSSNYQGEHAADIFEGVFEQEATRSDYSLEPVQTRTADAKLNLPGVCTLDKSFNEKPPAVGNSTESLLRDCSFESLAGATSANRRLNCMREALLNFVLQESVHRATPSENLQALGPVANAWSLICSWVFSRSRVVLGRRDTVRQFRDECNGCTNERFRTDFARVRAWNIL